MDRFNGLSVVNVELSSRCQKACYVCGRRKIERDYPQLANWGDMDFELVKSIAEQLPDKIVVQFHDNGESLLYPRFGEAVALFTRQIRCMDTNGKLIVEKADEIIGNLDTLTVSTFEHDEEAEEQFRLLKQFLEIRGARKPMVIVRCLGSVELDRYEGLGCMVATRIMHSPVGSFRYKKRPTVPEIGICQDMLGHMAIKRDGRVAICVRFDPHGLGIIGNCAEEPLADIWNSSLRQNWLRLHIEGRRDKIPLCGTCEFWGIPTGY